MKRFPALHTISAIFRILSWIVLVLAVVMAVIVFLGRYDIAALGVLGKLGAALVVLVVGAFYAMLLHAAGEMIMVFLAIEHNTRKGE